MENKYDFSGYATRVDLKCSDGRTIRKNAFKDCDGKKVPLVWSHSHDDPANVLGHALLENREDGIYCYGYFNDTPNGINAKESVRHGDITALSIYANKLVQRAGDVIHGTIREVSLVFAGANPGAFIDNVCLAHSISDDETEVEAIIYAPEDFVMHSEEEEIEMNNEEIEEVEEVQDNEELEHADGRTVKEVYESMSEEKKKAVEALFGFISEKQKMPDDAQEVIAMVIESMTQEEKNCVIMMLNAYADDNGSKSENSDVKHSEEIEENGGNYTMKTNVFEQNEGAELQHGELSFEEIAYDARKFGSLRDSFLEHAAATGITDIDNFFPEVKTVGATPELYKRRDEWVDKVLNAVHHTPFSRIKTMYADITADAARAKGYIKGNQKETEVIVALKRTTFPQTVYKLQWLDRDDILDITDFDVVAWIKAEMRGMLDEEIARAVLIGDGRLPAATDKIDEQKIRPVYTDVDTYTIKRKITITAAMTNKQKADVIIEGALRAREEYRGSGTPTFYCSPSTLTTILLAQDLNGHRMYTSNADVAAALRCKEVVEVPVMDNVSRVDATDSKTYDLDAIIVNLSDYNVGADKGGAVAMFDDFDIDFNQNKYLIETRCSGALIRPYSAIVVEHEQI